MRTFVSEGIALQMVAAVAMTAGHAVKIGSLIGIPATNAAIGDTVTVWRLGVYDHDAATSQAWTAGDPLYWDDTAKVFTKTVGSNTKAAIAAEDKAAAAATGRVCLIPTI